MTTISFLKLLPLFSQNSSESHTCLCSVTLDSATSVAHRDVKFRPIVFAFLLAPPEKSLISATGTIIRLVILARNLGGSLITLYSHSMSIKFCHFHSLKLSRELPFWPPSGSSTAAQPCSLTPLAIRPSLTMPLTIHCRHIQAGLPALHSATLLSILHPQLQIWPWHKLLTIHCLEEKVQVS